MKIFYLCVNNTIEDIYNMPNEPINFEGELNQSQLDAVMYNEGPSLVIAGAGSGKTRVLTYKIAWLLQNGYEPWSILALTFTNKAAREMKQRIADKVGERAKRLWMGTFHSIFYRILRTEAASIGFPPQFTIYDTSDSKSLLRSILKELGLDEKQYKPGSVQAHISNAKNRLIGPKEYSESREIYQSDIDAKMPAIRDVYTRYWNRCKQAGAMDFDDLLFYTYLLFRDHPQVLAKYASQFKFMLVDEYQDTNYAQHSIVVQLCKEHHRVCVVGDDAQSIYSFRGANIDNILNFTQTFPGTRTFKLEQNYRSTQTIVNAANSLIEKNVRQIHKSVFSENDRGEPIPVIEAYSDVEEADIVANRIMTMHMRQDYAYSDFAILYRTNAQSRVFEEALRKRTMPYRIYGGLSFYQRKEIKDVIAYFRLTVNPRDEEAFKRIINYPARGIGDTTLHKVIDAAVEHGLSLWEVISDPVAHGVNISKGTATKIAAFQKLIEGFLIALPQQNAYEIGQEIIKASGIYRDISADQSPEGQSRKENLDELVTGMHDFCAQRLEEGDANISLIDYLSEVSLITDQDSDKDSDAPKVTLMTVHSAKGLEFPNVFVVGMEEGLFPGAMSSYSLSQLEEERRLFYVAITRAGEHCFLSFAKSRFRYGKMEFSNPSRFLRDIDTCFLELPGEERRRAVAPPRRVVLHSKGVVLPPPPSRGGDDAAGSRGGDDAADSRGRGDAAGSRGRGDAAWSPPLEGVGGRTVRQITPSPPIADLKIGQTIEHERFGIGEVIHLEGSGDNTKATIKFQNAGEKQLLLRYARFKVIAL